MLPARTSRGAIAHDKVPARGGNVSAAGVHRDVRQGAALGYAGKKALAAKVCSPSQRGGNCGLQGDPAKCNSESLLHERGGEAFSMALWMSLQITGSTVVVSAPNAP